jgi:hypothetical protein
MQWFAVEKRLREGKWDQITVCETTSVQPSLTPVHEFAVADLPFGGERRVLDPWRSIEKPVWLWSEYEATFFLSDITVQEGQCK